MKLTFYETPGHGYLRVPKATFIKCGGNPKEISGFSGHDTKTLYLEEDCDATYFLNLLDSVGISYKINKVYTNSVANTHNYDPNLFGCKLMSGTKVVLYDNTNGVIERIDNKIIINTGNTHYRLPVANPFKYIKKLL